MYYAYITSLLEALDTDRDKSLGWRLLHSFLTSLCQINWPDPILRLHL